MKCIDTGTSENSYISGTHDGLMGNRNSESEINERIGTSKCILSRMNKILTCENNNAEISSC